MVPDLRLHKGAIKKHLQKDVPGGPVVKNPPCNAGDVGSIPGLGTEIPQALGQLSSHTATTEAAIQLESPWTAVKHPACHN